MRSIDEQLDLEGTNPKSRYLAIDDCWLLVLCRIIVYFDVCHLLIHCSGCGLDYHSDPRVLLPNGAL